MKNNRGNIPITILVIGVFAICGLAIFSFYTSDSKIKDNFVIFGVIEKINGFSDEIKFYKNLKKDYSQEMDLFNEGVFIGNFITNATFEIEDDYIKGTLMDGEKRILWVKKRFVRN